MKNFGKVFFPLIALSALSMQFLACSDDSSSPSNNDISSSSVEISVIPVSATAPVSFSNVKASVMSNGSGGEQLSIAGSVSVDNRFVVEGHEDEDIFFNIDSISVILGHVDGESVYYTDLKIPTITSFVNALGTENRETVSLNTAIGNINLDGTDECGSFRAYIYVYLTEEVEKSKYAYTALDSLSFTKACKVLEVSSSSVVEETCTDLEKVEFTLSNKLGTDQYALNFETGLAENPDVTLVVKNEEAYLQASDGVSIWEEGSQDTGILPSSACKEKFTTAFGTESSLMEILQNSWYIVKTSHGDYPFMAGKFSATSKTNGSLIITYYK